MNGETSETEEQGVVVVAQEQEQATQLSDHGRLEERGFCDCCVEYSMSDISLMLLLYIWSSHSLTGDDSHSSRLRRGGLLSWQLSKHTQYRDLSSG